jgi:hypothetical protein
MKACISQNASPCEGCSGSISQGLYSTNASIF